LPTPPGQCGEGLGSFACLDAIFLQKFLHLGSVKNQTLPDLEMWNDASFGKEGNSVTACTDALCDFLHGQNFAGFFAHHRVPVVCGLHAI
jgi:hypothetical protein